MYKWLQQAGKSFDRRCGWHRVGVVLSLVVIACAIVVLYHTLRSLDFHAVMKALRGYSAHEIMLASGFVALGYVTLTFYDVFALYTIGRRDVPYRVAFVAGFTSYSIGHNVGASAFTGGAVRYRIYSHYGLTAIEVAKICFVAGFTFWLGNATVLGLGVIHAPAAASAIDQLPPWLNRTFGVVTLLVLATYIGWVWRTPRTIGWSNWELTLPNGPLTLLQIVIGIVDLGCCAAAMYMLVPSNPYIGFITVATIFVAATLLGFASHSPGGLGVFDAAMLLALWQYEKEALVAGLLLFRLLYYLVPFALALAILGGREVWLSLQKARPAATPAEGAPSPATAPVFREGREATLRNRKCDPV